MTVLSWDVVYRDFVIEGMPASGPHHPHKKDIRDSHNAQIAGPFPDNRVIKLNNANEGTPNNIIVSAAVDIPAAVYQVLYILNVTQENTGPVTVSGIFERQLVTNTSRQIEPGYLQPGMALLCIDTGTELRLLSYGDAEAIQQAAENAANRAEDAAEAAESAVGGLLSNIDSRMFIETSFISPLVKYLRTAGYYAPGTGGAALYVRVTAEPSHAGKAQSADGAWWELSESTVRPAMFGAKGDLVADDADAINDCLAYFKAKNCSCHIPSPSVGYAISKPLRVFLTADFEGLWQGYRGKQITIDKGARFKATASMYAMMQIGDVTWAGIVRDGKFVGGVFDCNNLASVGVFAPFYELLDVRDVTVWNYNDAGYVMGAVSTPGSSYEGFLTNCHTNRSLNAAPAGSVSVRWNRGGDNHMDNCILKGHAICGVSGDGTWNMKLVKVHCWNNAEHGDAQYGFILKGGNQLIGCQVDMPVVTAAYRFEGADNALIGSNITKDTGAVGGYFVDLQTGATVVAIGCKIMASTGHELAGEVTGVLTGYTGIANQVSGVNIPASVSRRINASGPVGTGTFTVASLPATDRKRGDRAFVTDATVTTFATNVVGGGANWVPVVFNGNNWIIG